MPTTHNFTPALLAPSNRIPLTPIRYQRHPCTICSTQLRRESVKPEKVAHGTAGSKDTLYWLPPKGSPYKPFGEAEWRSMVAGKAKL